MRWTLWGLLGVFVLAALYWTFQPLIRSSNSETSTARSSVPTPAGTPAPNDPVLVGAGDIASCASDGDEQTAQLLDQVVASGIPTTVFTAGDNAYENGTPDEYTNCYAPTWGRQKARTHPVAGNHDYNCNPNAVPALPGCNTPAAGYFGYFGAAGLSKPVTDSMRPSAPSTNTLLPFMRSAPSEATATQSEITVP